MHHRAVSFRTHHQTAHHQKCSGSVRASGWLRHAATPKYDILIDAGPKTTKPDHTVFERSPLNRVLMTVFRKALVEAAGGEDSPLEGFEGIIDLARRLNDPRMNTPAETREKAAAVLHSLFPVWFTAAVNLCISQPFPQISARINAWTTSVACTWLMGSMEVNDIEMNNGEDMDKASLWKDVVSLKKVDALRFATTADFFKEEMGIDVALEPNYEDFSCQFCFGRKPLPETEDPILQTPCFQQCPTKKRFAPMCSKKPLSA